MLRATLVGGDAAAIAAIVRDPLVKAPPGACAGEGARLLYLGDGPGLVLPGGQAIGGAGGAGGCVASTDRGRTVRRGRGEGGPADPARTGSGHEYGVTLGNGVRLLFPRRLFGRNGIDGYDRSTTMDAIPSAPVPLAAFVAAQ